MAALAAHQMPNVGEGESPFSRLLDGRWAEICLGHLKDQEEYVNKRRALGKVTAKTSKEESGDTAASDRRRPKAKAKAKSAAAAEKAAET